MNKLINGRNVKIVVEFMDNFFEFSDQVKSNENWVQGHIYYAVKHYGILGISIINTNHNMACNTGQFKSQR